MQTQFSEFSLPVRSVYIIIIESLMRARKRISSYGKSEWDTFTRHSSFSGNKRKPLKFLSHSRRTKAVNMIHTMSEYYPANILTENNPRSECYRSRSNHSQWLSNNIEIWDEQALKLQRNYWYWRADF